MKNKINKISQNRTISKLRKEIRLIDKAEKGILEKLESGLTFSECSNELKEKYLKTQSLDCILYDAFALCRLASEKVLGMRHYDTQLMGAISLHRGSIAELRTGEGKTIVVVLAAYFNALSGEAVHVVTVNDYLAKRDADIAKPLLESLGVSVGFITSDMENDERQVNYSKDVLYATNSQLGFDYLRDNMAIEHDEIFHKKGLGFAIIDEVDLVLIDDARTPLIISGQSDVDASIPVFMKEKIHDFEFNLVDDDEELKADPDGIDLLASEKTKRARLTESGYIKFEKILLDNGMISEGQSPYHEDNLHLVTALISAARAKYLYKKDIDYLLSEGKVQIISDSTGRVEKGRRWSDGLHQAIEAKEHVEIKAESVTMGSISLQNYFRLYKKLCGTSGTAKEETSEFASVYGMGVVEIPTHKSVQRIDHSDLLFMDNEHKYSAISEDIREKVLEGRPVLVGTSSVEESIIVSNRLLLGNIPHTLLNAKNHSEEANIIAEAGRPGVVTIATNMAGRGTDILLGGNLSHAIDMREKENGKMNEDQINLHKRIWEQMNKRVKDAGGLHVIGTSRNDSRRIDNQLIGRSGRQGDPGSSQFYVSLDDRIMRLFNGAKYRAALESILDSLGFDNGGVSHRMIDKAIETSQEQIRSNDEGSRKNTLKFDDIVNTQRTFVYDMRREFFNKNGCWDNIQPLLIAFLDDLYVNYLPDGAFSYDFVSIDNELEDTFGHDFGVKEKFKDKRSFDNHEIKAFISEEIKNQVKYWVSNIDDEARDTLSRKVILMTIDSNWRNQLVNIDQLRDGIHLRGYAQKQPIQEFGHDTLALFKELLVYLKKDIFQALSQTFEYHIKQKEILIESIKSRMTQESDTLDVIDHGEADRNSEEITLTKSFPEENHKERNTA